MVTANEFKKIMSTNENGFMSKGETSKNDGHSHKYDMDDEGNGETDNVGDHAHSIEKFKVMEENDHTHMLQKKEQEPEPKKDK